MPTVIFGGGNLGRAIATGLVARGETPPRVLSRPAAGRHRAEDLVGASLVFDASQSQAVVDNLGAALDAGCQRFVIATTGWDDARRSVEVALREHRASAVVASNFSLGVGFFLLLVECATGLFGSVESYDPYVLEWHRREKSDRPSGTALEIARRLLAAHPRKSRISGPSGRPERDELEVVSLRAGSSPGAHIVGFDAPGETVELRLTARDRSAYVAGALTAADWLARQPRSPGIHSFATVIDELIADPPDPVLSKRGNGLPEALRLGVTSQLQ